MKSLLSAVFLIITGWTSLRGQPLDWTENNKYWYYRNRLVTKFLVRGEQDSECNEPSGLSIPAKLLFTHQSDIRFADGGAQLGWYISVLATEYRLQVLSGRPSGKTLEELYYAMRAYERLDRKAETLYYAQNPNADCSDNYLNGLFVRDDIGINSFSAYPEFRNQYLETDDSGITYFDMTSDYSDNTANGTEKDNVYPSADQITDLFMGFALVAKCVGNVSYQGYNFLEHAVFYTDKIASRLSSLSWVGRLENGEKYDNGETFLQETTAYGIANAAQAITGQVYTQSLALDVFQVGGWNGYADPFMVRSE